MFYLGDAQELLEQYLKQKVEFVTCIPRTWNNGALGCPEPGRCYTQALVSGSEILFQCGDEIYSIHTDHQGTFLLATTPPVNLRGYLKSSVLLSRLRSK